MKRQRKTTAAPKPKRKPSGEVCNNYLKICPMAGKCDNCRNRALRPNKYTGKAELVCRKNNDINGDHYACFVCSEESKCKRYD